MELNTKKFMFQASKDKYWGVCYDVQEFLNSFSPKRFIYKFRHGYFPLVEVDIRNLTPIRNFILGIFTETKYSIYHKKESFKKWQRKKLKTYLPT